MRMPSRRAFLAAGAAVMLAPLGAGAQSPGRVYRLGVLLPTSAPAPSEEQKSAGIMIPAALRELGYVEGRDLVIERRYAGGKLDRLPGLARELVQLQVDVIVVIGLTAVRAAREATTTIPLVLLGNVDPVAAGLVPSLARPGANITGVLIAPDGTLAAKKLELLKAFTNRT